MANGIERLNQLFASAENPADNLNISKVVTTQEERDEASLPQRKLVYQRQLLEFPQHPFPVQDDEDMQKLTESILKNGIRTPIEVIPTGNQNEYGEETYYIIAGHRRRHVAELIYDPEKRLEIRIQNLTFDEATIAMTESNLLSREKIPPCVRGRALRMQIEAMGRINGSHKNEAVGTTRDIIAKDQNLSGRQVAKYVRLSYLIDDLQNLVDSGSIGITTAVELSFLTKSEQTLLYEEMDLNDFQHYPSTSQAKQLRKYSKEGSLDIDVVQEIMAEKKPNQQEHVKYSFSKEKLEDLMPDFLHTEKWNTVNYNDFIYEAIMEKIQRMEAEHESQVKMDEAEKSFRMKSTPSLGF